MSVTDPNAAATAAPSAIWPRTALEWIDGASKIALLIALIAGGIWGLLEYRDRQQEARVSETLKYAQRFEDDALRASVEALRLVWDSRRDALELVRAAPEEHRTAMFEQLVFDIVRNTPPSKTDPARAMRGMVRYIDRVVQFFDGLEICMREDICDRKTANAFFGSYAHDFYCRHEPFITDKRTGTNIPYAQGLVDFAAGLVGKDRKPFLCELTGRSIRVQASP